MMKKFLSDPSQKFDIVIVGPFLAGEAGYYLAHKFKVKLKVPMYENPVMYVDCSRNGLLTKVILYTYSNTFRTFPSVTSCIIQIFQLRLDLKIAKSNPNPLSLLIYIWNFHSRLHLQFIILDKSICHLWVQQWDNRSILHIQHLDFYHSRAIWIFCKDVSIPLPHLCLKMCSGTFSFILKLTHS